MDELAEPRAEPIDELSDQPPDAVAQTPPDPGPETAPRDAREGLEIIATIVLAVATVLTAWSAFQSTKWGGVQANGYAQSAAARAESTKLATHAGQLTIIDVTSFEEWLGAIANDPVARAIADTGGPYQPRVNTLQYFLYERFRPEFKTAFDAWILTRPLTNANAPKTPFQMPEYVVSDAQEAQKYEDLADARAAQARQANQRGDNYVLLTVLFATALFFAGVGTKLRGRRPQQIAIGLATVTIVVGTAVLVTFPKEI
jgi:hypothetical protein